MNGAPPPGKDPNKRIDSVNSPPVQNAPNAAIQATRQASAQLPATNSPAQPQAPNVSNLVTCALQGAPSSPKQAASAQRQFTCSDHCIAFFTGGAWQLNPQYFVNQDTIDIVSALFEAEEVSFQIHQNSAPQGVVISYDGYCPERLEHFFTTLDKSKRYFLRTGAASETGHFLACYYDPLRGWMTSDSLFGVNPVTNLHGRLTSFGYGFVAQQADWGPYDRQSSLIFVEATPRRVALLGEYILRHRYFGSAQASAAVNGIIASNGIFPARPYYQAASGHAVIFPHPLPVPIDAQAMHFANQVAAMQPPSGFVPYENRSAERALMAISTNGYGVRHDDTLNTHSIDLRHVLIQAGEINLLSDGRISESLGSNDRFVSNSSLVSQAFANLDRSQTYLVRLGFNSGNGRNLALRYRFGSGIFPGWYYYGKQDEMQIGEPLQGEDWFLLCDNLGHLSTQGQRIVLPQAVSWGEQAQDFSMQILHATQQRQELLQRYVSYSRHISDEAALSALGQHARRRAERELETLQHQARVSFLSNEPADELHDSLIEILAKDEPSISFLRFDAPSTSSASSVSPLQFEQIKALRQAHINHLAQAMKNDNEAQEDKAKFLAVKLLLEGSKDAEAIHACHQYWANAKSLDTGLYLPKEKLKMMLDYYLCGGLELLRGFSIRGTTTTPYSAKHIAQLVRYMKTNRPQAIDALLQGFKTKVAQGEIAGISHNERLLLPKREAFVSLLKRCGFTKTHARDPAALWFIAPELTPTISTQDLNILSSNERERLSRKRKADESVYLSKMQASSKRLKAAATLSSLSLIHQPDDNIKNQQKSQLQQAIDSNEEHPKNKLKCIALLGFLNGEDIAVIRQRCDQYARDNAVSRLPMREHDLALMFEHYQLGGFLMLRGYLGLVSTKYSTTVFVYILNLIEQQPHLAADAIHRQLVIEAALKNLPPRTNLPTLNEIRDFLTRCGYTWNIQAAKWV